MISNNFCGGHVLRIAVGITVLVLLLAGDVGAAMEINSCTTISSPGEYVLTKNIIDFGGASCIIIASDDVIFDGAGYTIDGRDIYGTRGVVVHHNYASVRNVTVKNLKVTDWGDYGMYLIQVDGSIINSTASSNLYGIFLYGSSNITLINNTAISNFYDGIILSWSSNNTIINNAASSNSNGIHLISYSEYNILTDNIVSSNGNGINLQDTNYNTLTNNSLRSNNIGIYLYSFSDPSSNNTIYDNYFNNTNNFGFDGIIYSNYWNTTKTAGKNIIGGPYFGGNFWADPDGTGFSQSCTDVDKNGICDAQYTLDSDNIDFLPLAAFSGTSGNNPIAICRPDKLICENIGTKVQFNGTASYDRDGTIISYYWEFGDGATGTDVVPNHTYAAYRWNGSTYQPFTVNLTVTDNSGLTNKTSQNVTIWIAGDANGDGKVNILDASVIGLKWNGNDPCADLNNDGKVNILDANIIGLKWGKPAIIGG